MGNVLIRRLLDAAWMAAVVFLAAAGVMALRG